MSLRKSGADCPNDAAKLMRRGVLALAVLLLACVLMAGAVSAGGSSADVSSYAELIQNLSDKKTVINLTTDIIAPAPILVNYSVTINGKWHTITADNSSGGFPKTETGHGNGCDRHLLCTGKGIAEDHAKVNLTNIIFENYNSNGGAWGIQFTNESDTVNTGKYHMITLENVVINGSQGSGITLKSENMTAVNLTIQNSGWGQSIDVEAAKAVNPTWLKVDEQTYDAGLKDLTMISNEGTTKATVYRGGSLQDATHSWFHPDKKAIYGQQRIVWATAGDYATKAKSGIFNASVQNSTDSIIDLHTDLSKALTTHAAEKAIVTQLKDITLETETGLTISSKNIIFDGAGKSLTLNASVGKIALTSGENTILKNLKVTAKENAAFGTAIKLGQGGQLLNSNIDLSNLKSEHATSDKRMSSIAVYLSGKDAVVKGNTITAGNSATSSSQCIVVGAATNATIADNILTTGTAKADVLDGEDAGKTSSGSVAIRISAANVKAEITNNTITSNKGASDTTRNVAFAVDGVSASGTVNATNNTITLASHLIQKDLGGYGVVLYLNTGNSAEVTANLHSNKVTGSTYVIYADNSSGGSSTTVKGEIFNNNFKDITTAVANHSAVTLTATDLKWNITPASLGSYKAVVPDQTSVAGNYWTWSKDKKSTTGYMTFADAAAATAAGLPVADLAPLVNIGTPTGTITITGNLSIENTSSKTETLTAKFSDGTLAADATWTVTPNDVITLTGTGASVTYTPKKVGNATITVKAKLGNVDVSKSVVITVYEVVTPILPIKEPTKESNGNTTITASSGGTISVDANDKKKATIEDTASGTTMIVTFKEDQTSGSTIQGNVTLVAVVYKEEQGVPPADGGEKVPDVVKYQLNLTLGNVTTILPEISPEYNKTVAEKVPSGYTVAAMITAVNNDLDAVNKNLTKIELTFIVPAAWVDLMGGKDNLNAKAYHIKGDNLAEVPIIKIEQDTLVSPTVYRITIESTFGFSSYTLAGYTAPGPGPVPPVPPVYSSGDGNMENSFRVLFDTIGGSFISPVTYLSYGDKISQPPAPTKDGYTFGGWYKDSACTQGWSFSEGIPGDMTLYAKWTPSSGGQSSSSQQTVSQTGSATAQQTVKATPAATQAQSTSAATPAASGTSASGSTSPAMTQAPAPVLGALLGLLAAGVLIRRRD